jgi:hypothetical protein
MLQKMSQLRRVPTFHSQLNHLCKQPVFGTAIAIPEVYDGLKLQEVRIFKSSRDGRC